MSCRVGDQHNNAPANPFEEPKQRITEFTAREIASLQGRLQQQLGPEFISTRKGPGGKNVHYIASDKVIGLANEVFGFNGWSSSIRDIQVDFVDENVQTRKVDVGLSVIVRVTLRDGTFHEDIGYGHIENCSGKAAAFEKAKKEGTTDALKRTLRNFGNVLGNCVYDKDYLSKVTKIKVRPTRFSEENLHRHSDFAPAKLDQIVGENPEALSNAGALPPKVAGAKIAGNVSSNEGDEELISVEFDDADFSFSEFDHDMNTEETSETDQSRRGAQAEIHPRTSVSFPVGRDHSVPSLRAPQSRQAQVTNTRTRAPNPQVNQHLSNSSRPSSGMNDHSASHYRPNNMRQDLNSATTTNQPKGAAPAAAGPNIQQPPGHGKMHPPPSNGQAQRAPPLPAAVAQAPQTVTAEAPIPVGAPRGFVQGRNAELAQSAMTPLKPFDPHSESPSIRRTAGFDHTKSAGVKRVSVPWTSPAGNPGHMSAGQGPAQVETTSRRVGAPQSHNSPLANRSQFRPVGKRPAEGEISAQANNLNSHGLGRQVLGDVGSGVLNSAGPNESTGPPEPKKSKLDSERPVKDMSTAAVNAVNADNTAKS